MKKLTTKFKKAVFLLLISILIFEIFFFLMAKQTIINRKYAEIFNYANSNKSIQEIIIYANENGYAIYNGLDRREKYRSDYIFNNDEPKKQYQNDNNSIIIKYQDLTLKIEVNEDIINSYFAVILNTLIYLNIIIIIAIYLIFKNLEKLILDDTKKIDQKMEKIAKLDFTHDKLELNFEEFNKIANNSQKIEQNFDNFLKQRNDLTKAIAHEFKSPLVSIDSAVQLAILNIEPWDYEKIKEITDDANSSYNENVKIITKIFNNEEKYIIQNINFNKLIIDKNKELIYANKNIKITQKDIFNHTIPLQYAKIIISNLFTNLLKYTKINQQIDIIIAKEKIIFKNKKIEMNKNGTQQGIILIKSIANQFNLNVEIKTDKNNYIVIISK